MSEETKGRAFHSGHAADLAMQTADASSWTLAVGTDAVSTCSRSETVSHASSRRRTGLSPVACKAPDAGCSPFPLFIKRAQAPGSARTSTDNACRLSPSLDAVRRHNDRASPRRSSTRWSTGVIVGERRIRRSRPHRLFAGLIPCAEQTVICGGGNRSITTLPSSRSGASRARQIFRSGGYLQLRDDLAASVRPRPAMPDRRSTADQVPVSPPGSLASTVEQIVVARSTMCAVRRSSDANAAILAAIVVRPVCHSAGYLRARGRFSHPAPAICGLHGSMSSTKSCRLSSITWGRRADALQRYAGPTTAFSKPWRTAFRRRFQQAQDQHVASLRRRVP